jgi:hypothetical protein
MARSGDRVPTRNLDPIRIVHMPPGPNSDAWDCDWDLLLLPCHGKATRGPYVPYGYCATHPYADTFRGRVEDVEQGKVEYRGGGADGPRVAALVWTRYPGKPSEYDPPDKRLRALETCLETVAANLKAGAPAPAESSRPRKRAVVGVPWRFGCQARDGDLWRRVATRLRDFAYHHRDVLEVHLLLRDNCREEMPLIYSLAAGAPPRKKGP